MRATCLAAVLLSVLFASCRTTTAPSAREVTFTTADGVKVFADAYIGSRRAPLVLLFHQGGGDARGEYGPIIPWLLDNGFNVVAVDQRLGGDRFGGMNRTAAGVAGTKYSYCDAYQDVEAALRFVRETYRTRPIVWGSSFSATLAIKLATVHPNDVTGVLAFSPAGGEPMQGCDPGQFVEKISVPLLVLRPASELEIPRVREQSELFARHNIDVFVAQDGVHGSSMLVPERVKGSVEAPLERVRQFLASVRSRS